MRHLRKQVGGQINDLFEQLLALHVDQTSFVSGSGENCQGIASTSVVEGL